MPEADKTALKAALSRCGSETWRKPMSYTEESVAALKDAVELAQSVLDNSRCEHRQRLMQL